MMYLIMSESCVDLGCWEAESAEGAVRAMNREAGCAEADLDRNDGLTVTEVAVSYAAGIWEQGRGFVSWSRHSTREKAVEAAIGYAKRQTSATGGRLSWAGGICDPFGKVAWFDREGNAVR